MADTQYVKRDGCLFRWLDRSGPNLEIYKKGSWEPWNNTEDWLDGYPLTASQAKAMQKILDS